MGDLNYRYYRKRNNGAVATPLAVQFSLLPGYFHRIGIRGVILTVMLLFLALPHSDAATSKDSKSERKGTSETHGYFQPESANSTGTVTVAGKKIEYDAVVGTLVVHPKDWDDAPQVKAQSQEKGQAGKNPDAEAAMSYVAYFKHGASPVQRPIMFLYNGGPGSSTIWLHMGAFGPRRVVTKDDSHTPAAPYQVVNNASSLLDASDLVFVDAPGTGFGRIAGLDKEKAFYGVDPDAHAFAEFIMAFLSRYGRWNSPKYLFGESYGTPRSAVLVNLLERDYYVDFNGVIMLSQVLNFDLGVDGPEVNPGVDLPYQIALPTYAATAWYHHKLPENGTRRDLDGLLKEVEHFAMTDYARALAQGGTLPAQERDTIASKLHAYTGLPVAYILKANLRISAGEFEKTLQGDADTTTGRLDTRFSGPTMDPLSKAAEYDPQSAALSSAYVSAFNDYVRKTLHYGQDKTYKSEIDVWNKWDFLHRQPDEAQPTTQSTNVMPDLAHAMKYNPQLKILLTGGYFDLATPFYEGIYEMNHLPIPEKLRQNISYRYYRSGHMVYAHQDSLQALHDDVAEFVKSTDNLGGK